MRPQKVMRIQSVNHPHAHHLSGPNSLTRILFICFFFTSKGAISGDTSSFLLFPPPSRLHLSHHLIIGASFFLIYSFLFVARCSFFSCALSYYICIYIYICTLARRDWTANGRWVGREGLWEARAVEDMLGIWCIRREGTFSGSFSFFLHSSLL